MKDWLELRKEIISTCLWLKEIGFIVGTWGNISVRVDEDKMLITPSRMEYEQMKPEDIVLMSLSGEVLLGDRLPTSEREVHRLIMKNRPDVGAIIHAHSSYAMAAAAMNHSIPPISEEMCQMIGGEIPLSKAFVPSDQHVALGEMAAESIGQANAVLLRNHGPISCGKDLKEAKVCCQIVEKSAKMYLHIHTLADLQIIPEEAVVAGRNYFLNKYGKS